MKRANSNTDQVTRSLLQKAVRRGDYNLTKKVIAYLLQIDEFQWLRKRLAVNTTNISHELQNWFNRLKQGNRHSSYKRFARYLKEGTLLELYNEANQ